MSTQLGPAEPKAQLTPRDRESWCLCFCSIAIPSKLHQVDYQRERLKVNSLQFASEFKIFRFAPVETVGGMLFMK